MSTPEFRRTLFTLDQELIACSSEVQYPRSYHTIERMNYEGLRTTTSGLFIRANTAYDTPAAQPPNPAFSLSAAAIRAAQQPDRAKADVNAPMYIACLEAEPRLMRSLNRRTRGDAANVNYLPDAILFDKYEQPYAYQKSDGLHVAFTWRDAEIETESGLRWVPAGSIIQPSYGVDGCGGTLVSDADPRFWYPNTGLVALKGERYAPNDVYFLRFFTGHAPAVVRNFIRQTIERSSHGLRHVAAEASQLTTADLASKCIQLLRTQAQVVR